MLVNRGITGCRTMPNWLNPWEMEVKEVPFNTVKGGVTSTEIVWMFNIVESYITLNKSDTYLV